ncbi:MAG: AAA ATPase central domain protein [Candidatus Collierbacteria bacterium GW2011_GWA1_42_60]|uniref:AAA ATPase central domain protein n=1 Tax=Candidatus Collierbacteria bacterium GW2011_GWA2_42_17 TaxID=1618378 RepID=A0A0G0Z1N7_9BACT|nr:MAG: AAA ATPase central domain protein [Candidatus Collierbacteria bacterium GW2011_GWB2_42_12]KKS42674.1 MAG: AAA ATPase central domain protein [Candidatus Collierbacteria bacterium GW2011_GWA2_42_17]KKS62828.1 MAG: AAA ATPase central domain protein [Candidatus Collierbacteria bacterium GW2011_GWE2_42_48]KKS67438.1 MAG: AAA ATPase central domain protein [Candidatus Collierbacteria bacterium GW2011_GWA1_42_60]
MSNLIEPLASKIRPKKITEYIGQEHLVGEGKPLSQAIKNKHIFSFVLWGPPGTGKTTIARIYSDAIDADFYELSAVSAGKDDIRSIIKNTEETTKPVVLFLDEIHRFNKAQQDYLLPFVERGKLTLIGATTENPSFEIIAPLLSRLRVFVLKELSPEEIEKIITRATKVLKLKIDKEAKEWLANFANGDARQAIGLIESTASLYGQLTIENFKTALQSRFLRFDKQGEEHYNTISAFIKSMRASNPDAALYYLARLVDSGEDPLFIARRMVIFASEDVASPTALVVANAVFQACQQIGYPECQENLAAGTVYLAKSPKDRRAYDAYMAALSDVKQFGNLPIPLNLRNAPTRLMKKLGYGKDYEMYSKESLLPDQLKNKKYLK